MMNWAKVIEILLVASVGSAGERMTLIVNEPAEHFFVASAKSLVCEAVERYDVDGVELDLIRFPFYFRAGTEGANAPLLTAFVREIRKTCEAAAARCAAPART